MKNHWLDKRDEEYTLQLAEAITEVRERYEEELRAAKKSDSEGLGTVTYKSGEIWVNLKENYLEKYPE
jgi:predicted aspartyl protease